MAFWHVSHYEVIALLCGNYYLSALESDSQIVTFLIHFGHQKQVHQSQMPILYVLANPNSYKYKLNFPANRGHKGHLIHPHCDNIASFPSL
jgi:hypothetical protein